MSSPANEQQGRGRRNSGVAVTPYVAPPHGSQDDGLRAPREHRSQHRAAAAELTAAQLGALRDVIPLLVRAVRDIESDKRQAKAAAVSLQMRKIDSTFRMPATGFSNFRALLDAAVTQGVIVLEPVNSDVLVKLTPAATPREPARVSNDLWSALIGWSGKPAVFRRDTHRTVRGVVTDVANEVAVEPISRDQQTQWMHDFTGGLDDPDTAALLSAALDGDAPARSFLALVRTRPGIAGRWNAFLREHVIQRAKDWAARNGIALSDIDDQARTQAKTPSSSRAEQFPSESKADEELRRVILGMLESMPLSELLRLTIPVQYTLRR